MRRRIIDFLFGGHRTRAVAHGHTQLDAAEEKAVRANLERRHLQLVGQRTVTTLTPGEEIVARVRRYKGVHESPAGSNRGTDVDLFLAAAGWHFKPGEKGEPWCAAFVSFICTVTGHPLKGGASASCYVLAHNAHDAGTWAMTPRVGDVVIFKGYAHTGIVTAVHADGSIDVFAGNTSAADHTNFNGGECAEHTYQPGDWLGFIQTH